ncbi:MAG: hypothetical protein J4F35_22905 [Candidatus Latescibacteria bacterium]|nr:hypothetical protein [Candidatus Latescibacterota bacterium]
MAPKPKASPIIFTDDGWIFTAEENVSVADLKEKIVDGYAGTGGALWWSTGDHEVYQFERRKRRPRRDSSFLRPLGHARRRRATRR